MKKIIGMVIWLGGLVALCIGVREGSDLAAWKMEYISWSDVILNMGFLGFFMSAFTLKMWKEMMRNEHNTEYYDVYYERGREIKREKNADAKLGGYFFTFFIGMLLAFVLSAVLSPFIFVYNLCMIVYSAVGKRIAILVIPFIVIGSAIGGFWTYNYLDRRITAITQEREARKAAERKVEEEKRAAERQAAEAKMAAEREEAEAKRAAERQAAEEKRAAAREARNLKRREQQEVRREQQEARRVQQEVRRVQRAAQSEAQVKSCRNCRGGGQVKVHHKCPVCNGRGRVPDPVAQASSAAADGLNAMLGELEGRGRNNRRSRRSNAPKEIRCTNCNGNGRIQTVEPCGKCSGTGKVNR